MSRPFDLTNRFKKKGRKVTIVVDTTYLFPPSFGGTLFQELTEMKKYFGKKGGGTLVVVPVFILTYPAGKPPKSSRRLLGLHVQGTYTRLAFGFLEVTEKRSKR